MLRLRIFSRLFLLAVASILIAGCGGTDAESGAPPASISAKENKPTSTDTPKDKSPFGQQPVVVTPTTTPNFEPFQDEPPRQQGDLHPEVVIKTNLGDITVRLDKENAPVTVNNFLDSYVHRGFYEGVVFHYVSKDMIIAGGFDSEMKPKETRTPISCESHNGLKNERGTIAMIRNPQYAKSATSQFFINLNANPSFDYVDEANPGFCVFGEVIENTISVADQIGAAPTHDLEGFPSTPVEPVVIQSIQRTK